LSFRESLYGSRRQIL